MKILVLLIGNELLRGTVIEKNAHYMLSKTDLFTDCISEVRIIPDDEETIGNHIKSALGEFDLVVCSGGLGPTADDLTLSAIAKALDLTLTQNTESLNRLTSKYQKRNREINQQSLSQTFFPDGAKILENRIGTADSCRINIQNTSRSTEIFTLPGVPREFRELLDTYVMPYIEEELSDTHIRKRSTMRFFGIPESDLGGHIESLEFESDITIGYRPRFPEIQLDISSNESSSIEAAAHKIVDSFREKEVFVNPDGHSLPDFCFTKLKDTKLSLSCAESCTGGLLAYEFTQREGASEFFKGSVTAYSNEIKEKILGVSPTDLSTHGAVSDEVAISMAQGVRSALNSDIGISTTGIAGPGGGSAEKPIGTIYIAIADHQSTISKKLNLNWDRNPNQIFTVWSAIHMLLMKLPQ